ncbi:MAG: heavy-metal-associated domain-containing protein, partial [Candidatus Lokiarchaeota archaeon]|nr:heavy-metal-associated domain-containing protein [Candidatus Lokiarchaeota archaeon]
MEPESKEKIIIKLGGMTCANCALKIENKLRSLNGVEKSVVNFANEEANIEYSPNKVDFFKFRQAIINLGYRANLSRIDVVITDDISEKNFDNLIENAKNIKGIYEIRGNYQAKKVFLEFNEFEINELKLIS